MLLLLKVLLLSGRMRGLEIWVGGEAWVGIRVEGAHSNGPYANAHGGDGGIG